MTKENISRRDLIARGATGLALLGVARATTAVAAEAACVDPKQMDSGQRSIRTALNYVEVSKDPAQTCSGCAFFQNPTGNCGTCQIFTGPTTTKGHCDSWSPKA